MSGGGRAESNRIGPPWGCIGYKHDMRKCMQLYEL